ncbi:tetratricopeptide repeat protein [Diaphorobacter sp. HDW4A]|uniref:tetratricopeptide repeat protein n=1 Tax=Diaphorobacter sp. HDW4A TaxID=2714924 RepID=UPI00140C798C|nr:tetratricopeptide repeat protein [Diaphorobacter sp. HDW4A]QIL82738.1 tetratricopeptide repeat protein [Diaphorobacter sp. HDW4A]
MGPLLHGMEAARALHDGQWEQAHTHLERALHALPDDLGLLQMRSQLAMQQGEPAVAVSLLQRAVALAPGDDPLACRLAHALLVSGDAEQACRAAQHAVMLDPRNATAQLLLAEGRSILRDWPAVELAASAALACDSASDSALMWLAQAQREQSRTADAEVTLRRLLQQAPTHMQALSDLGWLLYRAGRLTEARPLCEQAASLVNVDPQAASRQADSITLQNWGRVLLDCGEMDAAMQALELALERVPDSYRANLFVGIAWQELGEPDEASQWYERSLQLDAEAIEPLERLASMALKAEQFTAAHELLATVLARSPQRVQALGHRASVHL